MRRKSVSKFAVLVAATAVIAALVAIPSSASAAGATKCGTVTGPGIGAFVQAKNVKCGNALRYVNACISRGVAEPKWSTNITPKGRLQLRKNNKKISATLEGGFTTNLGRCTGASG